MLRLYSRAAAAGTLSRDPDEYTLETMLSSLGSDTSASFRFGAKRQGQLLGEIHATRLPQRRFRHVVGDVTLVVDPEEQGKGLGSALLRRLLQEVDSASPLVTRVELLMKETNLPALHLYRAAGFIEEGILRGRVKQADGSYGNDLILARVRR